MNNESNHHSVRANSPVNPSAVRVLRSLDPVARSLECAYFVAGATARDLILVNVHGLRPGRATLDIDLGIAIESWQQFAILKERLVGTGEFAADGRMHQRMNYTGLTPHFPVDLIPFRGVASAERNDCMAPRSGHRVERRGFRRSIGVVCFGRT